MALDTTYDPAEAAKRTDLVRQIRQRLLIKGRQVPNADDNVRALWAMDEERKLQQAAAAPGPQVRTPEQNYTTLQNSQAAMQNSINEMHAKQLPGRGDVDLGKAFDTITYATEPTNDRAAEMTNYQQRAAAVAAANRARYADVAKSELMQPRLATEDFNRNILEARRASENARAGYDGKRIPLELDEYGTKIARDKMENTRYDLLTPGMKDRQTADTAKINADTGATTENTRTTRITNDDNTTPALEAARREAFVNRYKRDSAQYGWEGNFFGPGGKGPPSYQIQQAEANYKNQQVNSLTQQMQEQARLRQIAPSPDQVAAEVAAGDAATEYAGLDKDTEADADATAKEFGNWLTSVESPGTVKGTFPLGRTRVPLALAQKLEGHARLIQSIQNPRARKLAARKFKASLPLPNEDTGRYEYDKFWLSKDNSAGAKKTAEIANRAREILDAIIAEPEQQGSQTMQPWQIRQQTPQWNGRLLGG